jgi:hypothetical protein
MRQSGRLDFVKNGQGSLLSETAGLVEIGEDRRVELFVKAGCRRARLHLTCGLDSTG